VQLVVPRGRAEVPDDRLGAAGQQRVAGHLVARPFADHRRGQISDVVDVEDEQRAELGSLEGGAGAGQPVGPQPSEVDTLLEVDGRAAWTGYQRG
jgi:hypothetical protein